MYIDCVTNSGKPYLRVAESYSVRVDGVRKNRKRTIRNIGPLSRFDDGKPDFLKRLKQSFKDGAPLIESLSDLVEGAHERGDILVRFPKDDEAAAFTDPKNIGYFFLDALYDALGVYDILNKYKSASRLAYDLNGHAKLLVFGRALSPDSKSATWRGRDRYLFDVVTSDYEREIFRSLDVLDACADKIQLRMNTKIAGSIGRNTALCYYDVTNYWFEIDDSDEDERDENGDVAKEGFRKSGPSKAKTRNPIVQMGLFIDDNGIPVAYRLFPGNHIDQTTLRPAMKKTIGKMKFGRVVVVADGGLNSGKNIAHILSSGGGYIVSKSAKGSAKDVRKWILEEKGYMWNETGTFKVKSEIRTRTITDENGEKSKITEKIISFWSKKQRDRAWHENRKFIEYLDSVIAHPDKLKDKQPKIANFIKSVELDKETGEVLDPLTLLSLDTGKINEYKSLLGYYTIMTSEVEMSDREVIDKYHGLSRIEDSFRVIKSDLLGRPIRVRKESHINAHFLTCFIALTMIRLIQYKILVFEGKNTDASHGWEMGLPANRIKNALANFNADAIPGGYYRLSKVSDDLRKIMDSVGIDAGLRLPTESELRQMKYAIDKNTIM